jgi:plastocyanin
MKQIYLIISIVFSMLFSLSLISANGLVVSSNSTSITKNYGSDYIFNITINNTEPITFYNISMQSNSYTNMPNISQLDSGQAAVVPVTLTSNSNGDFSLVIIGYYYSNIGVRSYIFNVIVTAYESNPCSLSIIRGDTVTWTSNIINTINLREYPSNAPVDGGTLSTNQSFSILYNEIGSKTYQWFVESWGFGQICTITTLPEYGYVNDPIYNGIINLNLRTIFEPTNITAQLFKTDYILDFFTGDEGSVFITNVGNETAKQIHLSGDWFTFDNNDFDLNSGYSKSVKYTIKPVIFATNETNKSYAKYFTITGNFPDVTENFNIFVNYAVINSSNMGNSSDFLTWVCTNYPELCQPKIIYQYVTNGSDNTTVVITAEQWRDYNLKQERQDQDLLTMNNVIKEAVTNFTQASNLTANQLLNLVNQYNLEKQQEKENQDNNRLAWITVVVLAIIVVMCLIGIRIYDKKKRKEVW